ncbi:MULTISPECIES: IS1380 family transposase [unclassified Streptomyces]|uniref:IS1380 family transposase n=1 Tax=unclassified Streptomyces TaxID=2593676 RepID=UPI000DAD7FF1|nr:MULTISPECIES: IS1380 family transposase [unclassified Streptomyces]PZT72088.1 IS1380 family transposase [Streptomyces sp. AC1-42T]PZT72604.1 IS1380 family transposase [Streptomyces sp. AC1-42T]PZT72656.1 IS1380 family transposase [Streptomyces sp. AC1-42T]PZT74905.1 IS1380 family transposase [Streptomyces sp. AC1-42T]PZT75571.1 IS1380 family transposase [Streptomyces sp. AC1-42W]
MKKRIGSYPRIRIEGGGRAVVSQAGGVLLVETVRKAGLDTAISAALAPWRKARAVHDPGKILLDVALAVALGGDCLADAGMLRAEPAVFGPVASDPTVSRLVDTLAESGPKALNAIRSARAEVRERIWKLAGSSSPDASGQVIVDLDGVLVLAHSDKQDAAATWKKTFGHHPLVGFVDHGSGGTGEPVAALLRPGNAGSNTAADHITTARLALAQLPNKYRRGRQTLIRTDSGGGTHEFVAWLAQRGRWLSYSVGMTITDAIHQAVLKIPPAAWTVAVEPEGEIRDGAWVAELDGDVLKGWPQGMRLIVRKERPHPGAQLRLTDADGLRLTAFATNTTGVPIAALELRHRQRARAEDRIRNARATGLRNLPLHDAAQNQIWLEIVQIALDLLAWMPMLALTGQTRRWEPRRLRLRLFSAAAQLVTTARRRHLRFAGHWPWTDLITDAIARLEALPNPG